MAAYLLWILFSWRGRIGRGAYALSWLAWIAINIMLSRIVHIAIAGFVGASPEQRLGSAGGMIEGFAFYAVGALILWWVNLAISAKRLHDFGWSGLWIFAPAAVLILGAPYEAISELGRAAAAHFHAGLALSAGTKLHVFVWAIGWIFGSLALWAMMLFRGGDYGLNGFEGGPRFDARASDGGIRSAPATISASALNGTARSTASATNWRASPPETIDGPRPFGRRGSRV